MEYKLCLLSSPENDTVEYNDKLSIAEMRQNKARLSPGPAVHMETVWVFPNHFLKKSVYFNRFSHGLLTPNEGINERYLNWADVADKICFGHT